LFWGEKRKSARMAPNLSSVTMNKVRKVVRVWFLEWAKKAVKSNWA